MKNSDVMKYEENFLLRKRIHTITPKGIRTQQNSFFNASDITTDFDKLGIHAQYKSNIKLSNFIVSITFLILGIKGLTESTFDDILFVISVALIASAIYWLIHILYNLKYIGSFYFSNSTEKDHLAFEIKSKYPPSKELEKFMENILLKKKEIKITELLEDINAESDLENLESMAKYIKRYYLISEEEYEELIIKINSIFKIKTENNDI